ncbi:hypothetical protein MXAN_0393 [Myxococcus xanthus DK 1622]|uniref:Uncharacterized protein n=1 Tax=Myxococcus xanthus (strain DK1622) TaxID=246197 RepID=Q1DFA9_MYXXD|nr:hypothetical protein MXAN_0393 [Myxococcus xanthus DK 1622]
MALAIFREERGELTRHFLQRLRMGGQGRARRRSGVSGLRRRGIEDRGGVPFWSTPEACAHHGCAQRPGEEDPAEPSTRIPHGVRASTSSGQR